MTADNTPVVGRFAPTPSGFLHLGNVFCSLLAWLSARTGQTLLLNRRGQRVHGGDLDTLARQYARGGLRVVDDGTGPAELAWQGVLANLHRIAGSDPGRSN